MRIAVSAIAKNEIANVDRFMQNLHEADLVVVCDTGSTDGTQAALRDRGAIVNDLRIEPWRFDAARNFALDMLPPDVDVVLSLDLDETISPGWRAAAEKAWSPATTRLRYRYVWSHKEDGSPGTIFYIDKLHKRGAYRWARPVHEVLVPVGTFDVVTVCEDICVSHYQDTRRDRSNYLPLLEMQVREDPTDARGSHYLGREYLYLGRWDAAIAELRRYLRLPTATWPSERAASMRYIARCLAMKKDYQRAGSWLYRATVEVPDEREPWVDLAKYLFVIGDFEGAAWAGLRALKITKRSLLGINESFAWGAEPHLLTGTALRQAGDIEAAREQFRLAATFIADPSHLALLDQFQRAGCDPVGMRSLVQEWVAE